MTQTTLLRGGWIITMVPGSEPARGDVLIRDSLIAAVGRVDPPPGAEVVDATDRIILPGLVDSHRHLWQSSLRILACDWTLGQYFARMRGQFGGLFRPEDIFAGTLLGAVEALDAGITTVVDWSHNLNTPAHADAAWAALQEGGGRAVFAYGATNDQALRNDVSAHTRDVARLRTEVAGDAAARVTLAMAVRGPEFTTIDNCEADWGLARELGVPMTVHVGGGLRGAQGGIRALSERGLLGPDTTYVHCNMLSDAELELIASSGGRASVSPEVEANMGHGPPATARLRSRGIPTGISADVCTNVGGDLFGAMRVAIALQRGADHAAALTRGETLEVVSMTARDVLAMATVDGARAIGLEDRIGTLEVGKQADLLLLRTDLPNLAPVNDPIGAVVHAAGTHNVDTVYVAGRLVKRAGQFVDLDLPSVLRRAESSRDYLLAAATDR
ncbi:amidohydrolase family protein [Nocardioides humilatus]|uniref:Amidohydrolase family protein n=1 Tax=Nocardioides humilatus TaxID=2607660 RepID=A0A5B1LB81_9ACTN|nr:amidohydrolase family protein [Nocardioides humilatus]KAA1417030.1 amidohydrolase family protein [Nocardioides humilatus]